jgi:hypothetical protein
MIEKKCIYCGTENELRPYADNDRYMCFNCMMEKPERESEAKRNFIRKCADIVKSGHTPILGGPDGVKPDVGNLQ